MLQNHTNLTLTLRWGTSSSIFHPHAANKCFHFSAVNYISSPIYVAFFIHMHQDVAISFAFLLESNIIQDGLKEKISSFCCSAFTWRWRRNSWQKKAKRSILVIKYLIVVVIIQSVPSFMEDILLYNKNQKLL